MKHSHGHMDIPEGQPPVRPRDGFDRIGLGELFSDGTNDVNNALINVSEGEQPTEFIEPIRPPEPEARALSPRTRKLVRVAAVVMGASVIVSSALLIHSSSQDRASQQHVETLQPPVTEPGTPDSTDTPEPTPSTTSASSTPSPTHTTPKSKPTTAAVTQPQTTKTHTAKRKAAAGGQSLVLAGTDCGAWSPSHPLGIGEDSGGPLALVDIRKKGNCEPGLYDGATAYKSPSTSAEAVNFGTSFSTTESTIIQGSLVHITRAACGESVSFNGHSSNLWLDVQPNAGSATGYVAAAQLGFPTVSQLKAGNVSVSGC